MNSVGVERRLVRQCPRRDDQRPLQGRARQKPRALARPRRPRVRHVGMGRLVQQPPPLRSTRTHPTSRVRGRLLPLSRKLRQAQQDSNQNACMKPGAVQSGCFPISSWSSSPDRWASAHVPIPRSGSSLFGRPIARLVRRRAHRQGEVRGEAPWLGCESCAVPTSRSRGVPCGRLFFSGTRSCVRRESCRSSDARLRLDSGRRGPS